MYEDKCAFVSKVPNNPVGMSAFSEVRHYGINTDYWLEVKTDWEFTSLKRK